MLGETVIVGVSMAGLVMLIYGGIAVFTLAVPKLFGSPSVSQSVCQAQPEALFFSKTRLFLKDWIKRKQSFIQYGQIFDKDEEK